MPLSSNPNATAAFALSADFETPVAQRPTFRVRFITEQQFQEHADLMRQASEADDNATAYDLLSQAIRIGVAGWERFKDADGNDIPWNADDLIGCFRQARMTERELWELAWNYPAAVRLIGAERPLSDSRASSGGARSADDTAAEGIVPPPAAA